MKTDDSESQNSNHQNNILLHKRALRSSKIENEQLLATKIHEFIHSPSSLRISASQVSALVGLHPYQNLPQLLCDFVYQSYLGQCLLQKDATALGLSLVDSKRHEEEQMLNFATAASKETKQLIQQVLEVSSGKRKLESVDQAQSIQKKIATQAVTAQKEGKVTQKQVDLLLEASRSHVSTGFGTCHEEEALDIYEKRMGCTVRERNEDLMEWLFERIANQDGEIGVSARPMGKARRRRGWMSMMQEQRSANDVMSDGNAVSKSEPIDVDGCASGEIKSLQVDSNEEKKDPDWNKEIITADDQQTGQPESQLPEETSPTTNNLMSNSLEQNDSATNRSANVEVIDLTMPDELKDESEVQKVKRPLPFFKIVGCVDGIRDEIYIGNSATNQPVPPNNPGLESHATLDEKGEFSDDEMDQMMSEYKTPSKRQSTNNDTHNEFSDNDNLILRPIVVECKHRMKRAQVPPPLYDQIQTCLYCQMYEVDEADLIQVVRHQHAEPELKADGKEGIKTNGNDNKHIEIIISRISLNDPIHNHQYHWNATLLPRLASFVDAVYSIRKDDTKRYRLLMSLCMCQDEHDNAASEKEAWSVLWQECPWLVHCDTSFGRKR